MTDISISQARADLAQTIRRAQKSPVRITNHGEAQVVLLNVSTYEKMLEDLEELSDVTDFDEAIADKTPGIPWEQVKQDLGF